MTMCKYCQCKRIWAILPFDFHKIGIILPALISCTLLSRCLVSVWIVRHCEHCTWRVHFTAQNCVHFWSRAHNVSLGTRENPHCAHSEHSGKRAQYFTHFDGTIWKLFITFEHSFDTKNAQIVTGLKLENYYFFTFTFSRPEVRKLLLFYVFTFSRPEVRKLLLFYVSTFSRPEVRKLFRIYVFTFSRPEVRKLFRIYFFIFSRPEVRKLFRIYVFTFSRPEVGKLFHISMA